LLISHLLHQQGKGLTPIMVVTTLRLLALIHYRQCRDFPTLIVLLSLLGKRDAKDRSLSSIVLVNLFCFQTNSLSFLLLDSDCFNKSIIFTINGYMIPNRKWILLFIKNLIIT